MSIKNKADAAEQAGQSPKFPTRFRVGNQAWKARRSHGRKPKFQDADELWERCEEYFDWVENNPLHKYEIVKYQGAGTLVPIPVMRAMSEAGLQIFLGIAQQTWNDYKHNSDFSVVTERVVNIIRVNKFEGAAAGLLSPNIIARDLGLKDDEGFERSPVMKEISDEMTYEQAYAILQDNLKAFER